MKKKYTTMILLLLAISLVSAIVNAQNNNYVSISLLNQDPDPAIAGDIVELRVGVQNKGDDSIDDLIIELIPEYPFEEIPGEDLTKKIETLSTSEVAENQKVLKFKVRVNRDAIAGSYNIYFADYEEGNRRTDARRGLTIDIKNKESAEVIYIDTVILVPGDEQTIRFTINNVGSAPLRDLTFSWENEDEIILPVGSDNTKYIKYIDVDDKAELSFNVIADSDATAGLYKLDLSLKYDDPLTNEEEEISTIAGIYVGGGTDFDVAFSETSSGTTSFTIANIGSNPAYSVSVIVPQQQGWSVSGSNSMIIGNLNTGDYTVASFVLQSNQFRQSDMTQQSNATRPDRFTQREDTQNLDSLKVQIAYTNTMGKREMIEKEVNINSQATSGATTDSETQTSQATMASFRGRRLSQESFFSKYKWYIVVLVVLTLFSIMYWKYKKEKHRNPNFKFRYLFKIKKHK
ncbi:COG1361 S-layer family protein [Candidatus Woesearchaeota archaeon]|nr:COG1361 S-layer family protein [Candidatus Woesearchaeota archaeon]